MSAMLPKNAALLTLVVDKSPLFSPLSGDLQCDYTGPGRAQMRQGAKRDHLPVHSSSFRRGEVRSRRGKRQERKEKPLKKKKKRETD